MSVKKKPKVVKKKARKKVAKKRGRAKRALSMLEVYERRFEETGSDIAWHQLKVERCSAGKHCACRPLRFTDEEILVLHDAAHSVHACGSSIQLIATLQKKLAREAARIDIAEAYRRKSDGEG